MISHLACPLGCEFRCFSVDPADGLEEIRSHVMWVHYTPRWWGDAENGTTATAGLAIAGVITLDEAAVVFEEEMGEALKRRRRARPWWRRLWRLREQP